MRTSIYIDGFSHGANPVPAGCVIGQQLVTGAIFGTVRDTGRLPESAEDQCRLMFVNAQRILQAAGADFADVIKMTFFLRPDASRELLNEHWVQAFPDPASRPARHVIVSQTLPAGMSMQCDLMATLSHPLSAPSGAAGA
jgi:2-iminobutanoate/2-iminopropanoate deaminase